MYLEVLKEAPSLFELLNTMIGQRFDAASPWVPVQTLRHWTGDTLAALLEGGLLNYIVLRKG